MAGYRQRTGVQNGLVSLNVSVRQATQRHSLGPGQVENLSQDGLV